MNQFKVEFSRRMPFEKHYSNDSEKTSLFIFMIILHMETFDENLNTVVDKTL